LAEELWERLGRKGLTSQQPWPVADPALLVEDSVEYPVQVNGKVKDRVTVPVGTGPAAVVAAAKALPRIQEFLKDQKILKEIHVPGRMVNLVTAPANGRN
jgi:leucyl-tRNA synthetase